MKKTVTKAEVLAYPSCASVADGCLTLLGQPESYFAGQYDTADEINPIGQLALRASPVLFAVGLLLWIAVFLVFLLCTNSRLATWCSLLLTGMHIFGAGTWLIRLNYGIVWVIIVFSIFRFFIYPRFMARLAESKLSSLQ